MEPRNPVQSFEMRETRADDVEGPIHHHISHGGVDVRDLLKHNMGGCKTRHNSLF